MQGQTIQNLGLENVSILTSGYCIGSLVGWNSASITNCYTTGSVSGDGYVGGLAGESCAPITLCYSICSVSANYSIGGLIGWNCTSDSLHYCYAAGPVSGTHSTTGGFIGNAYNLYLNDCFWDVQATGQTTSAGGIGKTTDEMMTHTTFTDAGWDFSAADGDAADWMMLREGEDYPRLAWQTIYPGDISGLYGVNMSDLMEVVNNWLESRLSIWMPTGRY